MKNAPPTTYPAWIASCVTNGRTALRPTYAVVIRPSQRPREVRDDDREDRRALREHRVAEIAAQKTAEELEVLLVDRRVEVELEERRRLLLRVFVAEQLLLHDLLDVVVDGVPWHEPDEDEIQRRDEEDGDERAHERAGDRLVPHPRERRAPARVSRVAIEVAGQPSVGWCGGRHARQTNPGRGRRGPTRAASRRATRYADRRRSDPSPR